MPTPRPIVANRGGHTVMFILPVLAQAGDGEISPELTLQRRPIFADFVAMKAIHNFVVMGFTFRHNNRLGESIEFERLAEQPFFRRGNVIGVVVVSDNRVLFDPENAVYRLLAKRAVFMDRFTKGIDGSNPILLAK